ncbi:FAD-dependent oxidoreductase [Chitinophaga horti]|uniref:FAD-dependent oxidoreductase n=1 Tax=Chitinophaga horti TaxID=2920382 RepID=UPI003D817C17
MRKMLLLAGLAMYQLLSPAPGYGRSAPRYEADIIIYGGTSAAVTAAVQARKLRKTVIIVSPDKHLGGLTSGGLGFTDTGNKSTIGGLAREFYHRVYLHYQTPGAWRWQAQVDYGNKGQGTPAMDGDERTMWIFEPHVAEKIFEDFIREHKITVYRDEWLDRKSGVVKNGPNIQSIRTLSGKVYAGKIFIDATYEGDLMAAAGVSYHVGREANRVYNEQWNGIQVGVLHHGHYFKKSIHAYKIPGDPASGLLPAYHRNCRAAGAMETNGYKPTAFDYASRAKRPTASLSANRQATIRSNTNFCYVYSNPAGAKHLTSLIRSPILRPTPTTTVLSASIISA